MIEREVFMHAWEKLAVRFRAEDVGLAADYFAFLSPRMSNDSFLEASRSLWATSTYLPRPIDFLLVESAKDWRALLDAIELYAPPVWGWHAHHQKMTERGRAALTLMGGMTAARALWEKSPAGLRREWDAALERAVQEEASESTRLLSIERKRLLGGEQ
jgi:hypothetical protein